jgi:hypothetical protein
MKFLRILLITLFFAVLILLAFVLAKVKHLKNALVHPLESHAQYKQICTLPSIKSYSSKYYYNPRGDGNCGYYSILFIIYENLANEKSQLYINLFSHPAVAKTDIKGLNVLKCAENVKSILKKQKSFASLTSKQMIEIVQLLRYVLYEELASERYRDYIPENDRLRKEILEDMYEYMSNRVMVALGNIFKININIIVVGSPSILLEMQQYDQTIELLYINGNHYQALIDKKN